MFSSFAKALGQLSDPRFLRVVLFGIALAVALLIGVYAGFLWLIETFSPGTVEIPLIGPVGGLDTLLGWGSALLMLGLSVFLMMPVASAFSGLFLEDVASAVEDRHYPGLPAVARISLLDNLIDTANFVGLMIAVNVVALLLYAVSGPFIPLVFWGLNGLLLGREYFTLTATRRIGRTAAKALRRRHWGKIWIAGTLMAAPLSIPLINLIIPVLGVATFTHLFHTLNRQ
ncbi:MAG: EI24 domain-containing protein [Cypionkella sp.]|uniref:EI24 domain-containing protein n=1 Tax=Cypionkella sp. TaxID=2811411 RepID=UPI0027179AA2|nr:EI24 domain-containing protein [Cypionkella sp.]MDO8327148.1 EI24 domain-containing protein [Cypionkella sp.]